jgi:protocatechuate 3,4-dioxygenase beta subunit
LVSRRDALRITAVGVVTWATGSLAGLGCQTPPGSPGGIAPATPIPGPPETAWAPGTSAPGTTAPGTTAPGTTAPGTRACAETPDNIEGPFYLRGAPERGDLVGQSMKGIVLAVEGRITGLDCATGLGAALLDVWQADSGGKYSDLLLRGTLRADAQGNYRLRTIVPGHYLNGARYRPAHIHVKLSAPGYRPLTTQLYFPDDPYNEGDPFIHRSLIMAVSNAPSGKLARYDFALRPV